MASATNGAGKSGAGKSRDWEWCPGDGCPGDWCAGESFGGERFGGESHLQLPELTEAQKRRAGACFTQLQRAETWGADLPVLLLNRCWLRLTVIPVERLAFELPPDLTQAAPELVRYRELIAMGWPAHQVQQQCWLEFGPEAFHQALQRFWTAQERGPHGWTLERYLSVLTDYRQRFALERPRPLPLLVLGRPSGRSISSPTVEVDGLFWLRPGLALGEPSMRHTCA